VRALKGDAGLRYNPERIDEANSDKPFSAKDMFIYGLLSDERVGTCNTIPVLITAVGRRLGYPLYLCCTHQHIWTRWDGRGERFNIEASGPNEFSDFDDEHYRKNLEPARKSSIDTSYYLKNLMPPGELALFLFSRGMVLHDHKRYEEALSVWAKCCFLVPTEPSYPLQAHQAAFEALHVRKFGKPSWRGPDGRPLTSPAVGEDLRKLLPTTKKLGMYLSIMGHFHEVRGEIERAVITYKGACSEDPHNPEYRTDIERYLIRLAQDGKALPVIDAVGRSLGLEKDMVAACQQRGLQFEKAKDWAEAQCAYVHGLAFREAGLRCREYLKRVVHREITAGQEPRSGQQAAANDKSPDPRLALPRELQAVIWSTRDLQLRSLGRLDEALAACKETCTLWPGNRMYAEELKRFSRQHARVKAQQKASEQGLLTATHGHVVLDIGHDPSVAGVSAPVHTIANWFSGSVLLSLPVINQKE